MKPKKTKSKETSEIFKLFKSNPIPPIDPLFIKMPSFEVIKSELRYSGRFFQDHRMFESAKWITELLNSVTDPSALDNLEFSQFINSKINENIRPFKDSWPEEDYSQEEQDALLQIRSLFDLREYKRCSYIAHKTLERFPKNQTILFFKVYSIFIKEKLKREEEQAEKNIDSQLIRKLDFAPNFD